MLEQVVFMIISCWRRSTHNCCYLILLFYFWNFTGKKRIRLLLGFLREKKPCGGTSIILVCFVGTGGVHDHFLLEAEHAQLLLLNFLFYFCNFTGKKRIRLGDRITRFFHLSTNLRRSNNLINQIALDGENLPVP